MTTDLATRSYWLGLDPYQPDAPLEGEMRADLVIVGGGFCGLWRRPERCRIPFCRLMSNPAREAL